MAPDHDMPFSYHFQWYLGKALGKPGARASLVVKALGYKPEDHRFETQWGKILNLPNL
jgi:hypothetical protein